MSLSASNDHLKPSGKTPPPAPSAAFAKRARELQAEERLAGARYRPPALREPQPEQPQLDVPAELPPPAIYPPGFKRARAGTLPSNVQLAAQRYASTIHNSPTTSVIANDYVSTPPAAPAPARPSIRHATTTATPQERNSRLRSGSLTLPTGGLSNAFGPSIFSSSWLSNNRGSAFPVLDELRSMTSNDSGIDDFDVHTLDYLGLDEAPRPPPPATVSELRNQAQAAIAGRLRASTVSNPYRTRPHIPTISSNRTDDQEQFNEYDEDPTNYPHDKNYYGAGSNSFMPKGFKQSQHLGVGMPRPRATSVGNLDDPTRLSAHRRAVESSTPQQYSPDVSPSGLLPPPGLAPPNSTASSMLRTPDIKHASGTSSVVRYPGGDVNSANRSGTASYLNPPSGQTRSVSPKAESPQLQTPSRSLWIGNLDPTMTSEQLIHVFAPYGAIESLRLLPEKECGFVNFVDANDAIRAKDDVLNRLGGHIGMSNGQAVRIGYGKADSAPVAPSKTPATPVVGGTLGTSSHPAGHPAATGPNLGNSAAGMEAQLQSSPTRALWIGSIPSTTTPATILSVFSPYGPIESARVLTHKNCGFINFERLDDAVRARKALNGRDVLGSDVGAIRIGFARVPVKSGPGTDGADEGTGIGVQGVGDLTVGATIHALRSVKGASTIPADQQVLGGSVENYRSNLLLSMIASGTHSPAGWTASVTEQQMIMRELSGGSPDAEADIASLAEFRPPTMYYTTIPLVSERPHNRRWDASKLRELRKRLDSGGMTVEEVDDVAADFLDGEIVDLASDWLGNTVVQKLFERCSLGPRFAMLERIAPSLAMIGIHKNGTWAAQKIIECISTPEELALVAQNLRPYIPPLLLDQFGNYVVQCCLRFGSPANDFVFDSMIDRLWEIAQGRFGARSMRACLENPNITTSQQRRLATAVILNSIPLATNPNGALLLTWLLDSSGFPSRYKLLAPRFTPHLSHLCTHKLASLTVLRIVNQKFEPEASTQLVHALFHSPSDHVLTDVLGDQVNGVTVIHKILTSPFIDPTERQGFLEATKRVLIELKVIATQAYRRLIEEVGLPLPNFQPNYSSNTPQQATLKGKVGPGSSNFGMPGMPSGYSTGDSNQLASMMAALQLQAVTGNTNPHPGIQAQSQGAPPQLQINPNYGQQQQQQQQGNNVGSSPRNTRPINSASAPFSPTSDPFNPFALRSPEVSPMAGSRNSGRRNGNNAAGGSPAQPMGGAGTVPLHYTSQQHSTSLAQAGTGLMGGLQPQYGGSSPQPHNGNPTQQIYQQQQQQQQQYMYQMFQNPNQNVVGNYHS